jgi:DNA polymerase elongation subunit (family B)
MLAFDIETQGLESYKDGITVAAVYDIEKGVETVYNIQRDGDVAVQGFLCALDEADRICSYNGVKFDIQFIADRCKVSPLRYEAWILKLTDLFEVYRTVLQSTAGLNKVLLANGLTPKTGSGLQAIEWARTKQWHLLEPYCLDDAKLTWEVSNRTHIVLPTFSGQKWTMFVDRGTDTVTFDSVSE